MEEQKAAPQGYSRRQRILFFGGLAMMLTGFSVLGFFGVRKIVRELRKQKLMRENTVVEIPALHIKAPVLEGVELEVLAKGAGHFPGTGAVGEGNYCIAGHSSVLYKEYFNNLKYAEAGMEILLRRTDGSSVSYTVTDTFIVEPDETWILDDFGDCRVTIVTCTDDGTQRQIVVGKS